MLCCQHLCIRDFYSCFFFGFDFDFDSTDSGTRMIVIIGFRCYFISQLILNDSIKKKQFWGGNCCWKMRHNLEVFLLCQQKHRSFSLFTSDSASIVNYHNKYWLFFFQYLLLFILLYLSFLKTFQECLLAKWRFK